MNIGSEPLRFVNKTKYLGFSNAQTDICTFSHCSINVNIVYLTVIALLCTVPICGRNVIKLILVKPDLHLKTHRDVYLVSQIETVQMQCMQIIIHVICF